MMRLAVAYLRRSAKPTSSESQPISIEQQAAACGTYAQQHKLRIVDYLTHDGVSGGRAERFSALWALLQRAGATAVVAYHFDRLGRDLEHLLAFRKRCDRAGVEIHVIGQGRLEPIRSSNGFVTTAIHGLVAEHYRLVIGEKTRDALARLRADGRQWWGSRPPYGWRAGLDGIAVPNPAEQAVLARLSGPGWPQDGRSLRALAHTLASEGIVARNGRPFAPSTLWRLRRRLLPAPPGGEGQGQPAEQNAADQADEQDGMTG